MTSGTRILLLEDDPEVTESLRDSLGSEGYLVVPAADVAEARRRLAEQPPDLLLLDIALPGSPRGGLDFLKRLRADEPRLPVVIVSGKDSKANLLEAGLLGVRHFLTKGEFGEAELFGAVRQALEARQAESPTEPRGVQRLLGKSLALRRLRALIHRFAPLDMPVLILGPTGSGKELVALALHEEAGTRATQKLAVVNCAAMPETIIESHLFGHVKGAFTNAIQDYPGLIRGAAGGTLFLDEVGELSLNAQQRFLRFLETGQIQAVGSSTLARVQVRVVTASHQDLARLVEEQRFREDLWFRLNVLVLTMPPLRERPEDVEELALTFLRAAAARNRLEPRGLAPAALDLLRSRDWPGNVRQLRNIMERLAVDVESPVVEATEILQHLPIANGMPPPEGSAGGSIAALASVEYFPQRVEQIQPLRMWRHRLVRDYVQRVHNLCHGNITRTAELLKVDRTTVYEYLREERADSQAC